METTELILRGTASFVGTIGYGNIYKFQIKKIMCGNLDEKEITITILANDWKNSDFISTHLGTVEFEVGCNMRNKNEPYSLMPISGFVDKNRISWEIKYLKE